jgi:hypothetical protein
VEDRKQFICDGRIVELRVTENADQRDARGRLYAAIKVDDVRGALTGADLLLDEEGSANRQARRSTVLSRVGGSDGS